MRDEEPLYGASELPPEGGVTWRAPDLLIGIAAALLALFVSSVVLVYPTLEIYGEDSAGAYFGQFVSISLWHLLAVACIYVIVRRSGGSWSSLGLRLPDNESSVLSGRIIGLTFGLSIVARLLVVVIVFIEGLTGISWLEPQDQIPEDALSYDWLIPFIGLSVVVTAPIAEEILFRAFLFGGLRRYMPMVPAALISGAFFSLLHFSPALFIPFLLIGVMFAVAYERTHSIFVPMLIHFFFNLVSYLLLVFVV